MDALAQKWQTLFRESYCGSDVQLEEKIRRALQQDPDLHLGMGTDAHMFTFVESAIAFRVQ
jgi:hypothetical protein